MINRAVLIAVIVLILGILGCAAPQPVPTPTPTPTPAPPQPEFKPKIASFPFSWQEDEDGHLSELSGKPGIIEVKVHKIRSLGTGTLEEISLRGINAEKGYQFYGVFLTFRSLMHREWNCPYGVYVGAFFELQTDKGNIYRSKGMPRVIDLRPEQEKSAWDYFEIRVDEKPFELRHYDVVNPSAPPHEQKLAVAYVWRIEEGD